MQGIVTIGRHCLNTSLVRAIVMTIAMTIALGVPVGYTQTPSALPEVNISIANTTVAEPNLVIFTLTADPAPTRNLAVELYILQPNRINARPSGHRFPIPAGMAAVNYTIGTADYNSHNEEVEIRIMPGDGYRIGNNRHVQYSVMDAQNRLSVSVRATHTSIVEGEDAEFIFTLATPAKEDVTIRATQMRHDGYAILDEKNIYPVIAKGETETSYIVTTENDAVKDNSYQLLMVLDGSDTQAVANNRVIASTLVFDNDKTQTLGVSRIPQVQEGEDAVFAIRIVPPATSPVSVDYATRDNTARAGFDYFATQGTLVFAPGEGEKYVRVTTIDDNLAEYERETFALELTNLKGAEFALYHSDSFCFSCDGVIYDDDTRAISVVTSTPVVKDNGDMHFRFTLTHATTFNTTLAYFLMKYVDDELVAFIPREDFLPLGTHTHDVRLIANRDGADNATSRVRFTMHVEEGPGYAIDPTHATASVDVAAVAEVTPDTSVDEVVPVVTLTTNASVVDTGNGSAYVVDEPDQIYATIHVDPPPSEDIVVLVRTYKYEGTQLVKDRGTFRYTLKAGESTRTLWRSTRDFNDHDDRFVIRLEENDGYRIGDETPIEVQVNDRQNYAYLVTVEAVENYVTEGSYANYVLHATPTPSEDLKITYGFYLFYVSDTQGKSFGGHATIPAGENTTSIRVFAPDNNATYNATSEEQYVELYIDRGDTYRTNDEGGYAYTHVIDDDQGAIFVETNPFSAIREGGTLNITIRLTQALDKPASVDYATEDGSAKADINYIPQNGTLTFAPGETEQTISIQTIDNDYVDFMNSIVLQLSNPIGAGIPYPTNYHFIDDDDEAMIAISLIANDPDADTIVLQINSTAAYKEWQNVHYYVMADDGVTPVDVYSFLLPPDTTSKNFTLRKGDGRHAMPYNGSYTLFLRENSRYTLGTPDRIHFHTKGVPVISLEAGASKVTEPEFANFYLLADPPPKEDLVVEVALADINALNTRPTTYRHTISAGQARQRLGVTTNDLDSKDALVRLALLPPEADAGYVLGANQVAEIEVKDDDVNAPQLTLKPEKSAVHEGEDVVITATITPTQTRPLTIQYWYGVTYDEIRYSSSGRVVVPAGVNTTTIIVPTVDDNMTAADLPLDSSRARRIAYLYAFIDESPAPNQMVSVHVIEDDAGAAFSLEDFRDITEGTTQNISVHLSQALPEAVAVNYASYDITAIAGEDYIAGYGRLVFAPGEVTKTFTITTLDNEVVDGEKSFGIRLASNVGANISRGDGRFYITDDEYLAVHLEAIPRQHQDDNYSFRLIATNPSVENVTIPYIVHGASQPLPVIEKDAIIASGAGTTTITIAKDALAMGGDDNYTLFIAASHQYALGTPSHLAIDTTPKPIVSLAADMVMAANGKNATAHFTIHVDPPSDHDFQIGIDFSGDSDRLYDHTHLPQLIGMGQGQTEAQFSMAMTAAENMTTLVAQLLPGEAYLLGDATVVRLQLAATGEAEDRLLERANRIILPKTALLFADSMGSAIRQRITSAFDNLGTPTNSLQVEGASLQQFAQSQAQQEARRNPWDAPSAWQENGIDPTSLSFATAINNGYDSANRAAALWGQGFRRSFTLDTGDFSGEGDVRGGVIGVDILADETFILGLGVGYGDADFSFGDASEANTPNTPNTQGSHTTDAVTLHPYFGWQNNEGARLWGNAGFGEGDVVAVMRDDNTLRQNYTSVFDMRSLGLGGLVAIGQSGEMQFNLIGEGAIAEVKDATWGDWLRSGLLRLGIEWRQSTSDDKGNIDTSSLQIAARHDFADDNAGDNTGDNAGEDSTGVEVVGDLEKHLPEFGLTLDLQARVFVTDGDAYDEWGVAGGILWSGTTENEHAQKQGLSVAIRPQWGDTTISQREDLLEYGSGSVSHLKSKDARYDYDVRYGVPILGGKHSLESFVKGNDQDQTTIGSEVKIGRLRALLEQEARGNHAFIRYEVEF